MGGITDILKRHGIKAEKGLSQNFLVDNGIIGKIVQSSGIDEKTAVIEIGGGVGSLTGELLKHAGEVCVIEIDERLCGVLRSEYGCDSLNVINADVMKCDVAEISKKLFERGFCVKVCANLPYHITTPVIMRLLEGGACEYIKSMTLMMQKEVADRILSLPGSKEYGSITPAISYRADVKFIASVPPGCFVPRPGVNSSVLLFDILREKRVSPKSEAIMLNVIRASFAQRRKTLLNALYNGLSEETGLDKAAFAACFEDDRSKRLGITQNTRGEELSLVQFSVISDILFEKSVSKM